MSVIVCTRCGEKSPADTQFCGVCGTYLDWSGTEVAEQAAVLAPAGQPAVQQPIDVRIQRTTPVPVHTEPRPLRPGDLICGQCGAGNDPTRNFCRQCGHSLQDAEAVRQPWWRRFFPKRKGRNLGERPRRASRKSVGIRIGRVVRWALALVVAIGLLLYTLVPGFRTETNQQATSAKNWVRSIFVTDVTAVRPVQVTATGQLPEHEAIKAADNARNVFWAGPADAEQTLVFTFDRPVDIRKIIVHSGNKADFQSTHRPARLHLVYNNGRTFDVDVADIPDEQTIDINESAGTTTIEMHIVGLHHSLQGNNTVAISEIEFFEKAN